MVSAQTLKQVESAYATWNASKGATAQPWFDLMADSVSWRSIADGAKHMEFTRPYSTKEQVQEYFEELAKSWQMIFYLVRIILVQDDTVAAVGECCWQHRATGKIVHSPKLDVMHFSSDKITGFFEYFDSEQAILAGSEGPDASNSPVPKALYPASGARVVQGISDASRLNVQLLKLLYGQWGSSKGGSSAKFMNILAPQVSWGSLANGADAIAFTNRRMSREEVEAYFQGLAEVFEMKYYKVREFVVAGNYVLMDGSCSFTHRRTGKTFETPKADFWSFSNGKAIEFFEYYDTAAVLSTTR